MTKIRKLAFAVVPFLLAVACTDPDKLPAETAIKAAEASAATLTAEVTKFAPDQVKAFQDDLAAAKAAAAKKEFKAARATAEALPAKAQDAVAAAKAKMTEMKKAFDEGAAQLGEKITAIQARLAEKKLPGVAKDAVAKAKEAVPEIEAGLAKAKEQAATDAAAASAAVKDLAAKAAEIATSLKMQ